MDQCRRHGRPAPAAWNTNSPTTRTPMPRPTPAASPGRSIPSSRPSPRVLPLIGEFNHSRILVRGAHVEHWLNGVKVVEFETTTPEVGKLNPTSPSPISLQNHSSETWFRNIRIKPL